MWGPVGKICPEYHRLASRGLPSDDSDCEGRIFLSDLHTNNGFFFLLTIKYLILYWKNIKKTSRKSWICWDATRWRNFNITMISQIEVWPACIQVPLFVFYLPHELVLIYLIKLSHTGKNHWNPVFLKKFTILKVFNYTIFNTKLHSKRLAEQDPHCYPLCS